MTRLACLPLDDRPVNYDYPRELAALAGFEIKLPPREWLGNPWHPSRHAELVNWLERAALEADALLVALDTLGYGGLIPSRTSRESAEQVLARLSILKELKVRQPDLLILAYSVILRISRADSAEEEKEYWAEYGSRMFRLSWLEHKSGLGEADAVEIAERAALRAQIQDSVYEDYLQGRRRNHAVNRAMLDWLGEGVFDYLLLPQDDTADYGWNIAEARALQSTIRLRGLSNRAISYPGADETASLLLARHACQQAGFAPRVWPRYSSAVSAQVVTAYEDRPMHELLKAHLAPLNGFLADSPQQADLLLFLNAPAESQGAADLQGLIAQELTHPSSHILNDKDDMYGVTRREMTSPRRSVEEFVRALQAALDSRLPVALADVAFVNGADLLLGRQLMQTGLVSRLSAYAGWNTAGNTLGTVLAQAVLFLLMQRGAPGPAGNSPAPTAPVPAVSHRRPQDRCADAAGVRGTNGAALAQAGRCAAGTNDQQAAHLAFLFRRCLDDYYYQAVERTHLVYEDLPALGLAPSMERLPEGKLAAVEERLRRRLSAAAGELRDLFVRAGLVRNVRADNIHLPWQRLFEVGFDVQVELP
jgi:hypothetical protein